MLDFCFSLHVCCLSLSDEISEMEVDDIVKVEPKLEPVSIRTKVGYEKGGYTVLPDVTRNRKTKVKECHYYKSPGLSKTTVCKNMSSPNTLTTIETTSNWIIMYPDTKKLSYHNSCERNGFLRSLHIYLALFHIPGQVLQLFFMSEEQTSLYYDSSHYRCDSSHDCCDSSHDRCDIVMM